MSLHHIIPGYLDPSVIKESGVWDSTLLWPPGGRISVFGPSGRGKSTLIKILSGMEHGYTGELKLGGRSIPRGTVSPWPRLRSQSLSLVLQSFELFPDANGMENLSLLPAWDHNVSAETVDAWSRKLGLHSLLGRPVRTWSQGQQQRLTILRALVAPSQWLLLDEPFSHLDPASRDAAAELILNVCTQRGTGWILTHLKPEPELPCTEFLRI